MSALAEFFLIAFLIYLWESGLWLPDRGVVLRRSFFGRRWRAVHPDRWIKTRELGLVPNLPFLSDSGLAPCQAPPVFADENGRIFADPDGTGLIECEVNGWEDLHETPSHLNCGGVSLRMSSPRALEDLRLAKKRGHSPATAIRRYWERTLSPERGSREWEKWRLAARPLELPCGLLTIGFFAVLPVVCVQYGVVPAITVALVLWLLMMIIAARVFWIGRRVYPTVKSQWTTDALLCLVVPFHAMRALEIGSVHAMAGTHPAAMILRDNETDNPWLGSYIRGLLHPRPGLPHDEIRSQVVLPLLRERLARLGKSPADYEVVPGNDDDPANAGYCPRCLALFEQGVSTCNDCRGVPLKPLP
jgi:hypothetical protein